jgi:hypothetical protein
MSSSNVSSDDEWDKSDTEIDLVVADKSSDGTANDGTANDGPANDGTANDGNGDDGNGDDDTNDDDNDDNNDDWTTTLPTQPLPSASISSKPTSGNPMIIINVTLLHPHIHNKSDRNSNNNPTFVSSFKATVESNYHDWSNNSDYIASGVVIPCADNVFSGALTRLRDDKPGNYFLPVFPMKT